MMRELADNILDIAQNSIAAGASLVEIDIVVSHAPGYRFAGIHRQRMRHE